MFRKVALAVLLLSITAGAAASVSIQLDDGAFKVTGWTPGAEPSGGWASVFSVYVGQESGDTPAVFGDYTVENGMLVFRPRFPLTPGVSYEAVFRPPGGGKAVQVDLKAPSANEKPAPRTRVESVYPSSDILPENQLKMYVYFSAPMQQGDVWSKIHIVDDQGKAAVLPFVELEPELWDRSQKRLTMLFDPGRIKRGVKPNVDMGPVLEAGKRYTLIIDADLKDGRGEPLEEPFRKEFSVGPPERRGIDLKLWRITEPEAGTRNPLTIDFDRPLDYALLHDVFQVPGVVGTASVDGGETGWRFEPLKPWARGQYKLVIDMALEDLAGNRIGRPFDVDEFTSPVPRISDETTTLTFRVQ